MSWVGWVAAVVVAVVVIEFLRDHPRVSEAIGAGFAILCFLLVAAGVVLFVVKGTGCDQSGTTVPTYDPPPHVPNDQVIPPGGLDPPSVGGNGGVGVPSVGM